MKHLGTKRIETQRLILRKFKLSDAQNMFDNYASHDKVTEFLTWHTHKSVEDTKEYLSNIVLPKYEKLDTYHWAIVWKENGQVIGAISVVNKQENTKMAELGWVIGDGFWGLGIMPEAAKPVVDYLFRVGFERVQAVHHVANPKSGRVMEKIGMAHEGTLKKFALDKYGSLVDCDMWAITREITK